MLSVKNILVLLIIIHAFSACENNEDITLQDTLQSYLDNTNWENGAVIACTASDTSTHELWTFLYPESGATDIRLYETLNLETDPNALTNYTQAPLDSDPFFNGYLRRLRTTPAADKWLIVSLLLRDTIRISNPIRTKLLTKPTTWGTSIHIDQSTSGNPKFSWSDNTTGDNSIYFQVVADSTNNLISGTYTYENNFDYYNTDNVVLNITKGISEPLEVREMYTFTLMGVSEVNWVNLATIKSFVVE